MFEHVEDYLGFLINLKKKSRFQIFHIPLDLSVANILKVKPLTGLRYNIGHIHYFTKETGLAALKDTGYEIIDYFYTPYSIEIPRTSLMSWLAKFPRRLLYYLNPDIAVRLLGGYELLVLTK